jgi:hypothetical protein
MDELPRLSGIDRKRIIQMRKYMLMALLLLVAVPILAQQTRVNIQYDPQRNTEGILPFSTQV